MEFLKSLILSAGMLMLIGCTACQTDHSSEQQAEMPDSLTTDDPDTADAAKRAPRKPGFTEDYVSTNRVLWQKPEMVINLLGDLENKTVADIGAGRGYFALRMASKAKKVIAIDIDPRFINYVDSIKTRELPPEIQPRLETRLAEPDDPNLNPEEADIVLIVNTYMYMKNRVEYLKNLKNGIVPGGTLLIIDFKKKRTPIGPPSQFRIPLYQVEEELYEAGYVNVRTNDTALDYQYLIMAEK
jgi:SAM-dependent methyltransferase